MIPRGRSAFMSVDGAGRETGAGAPSATGGGRRTAPASPGLSRRPSEAPHPGAGAPPRSPRHPAPVSIRKLLLPTEHGAWGFLAEPIALGLLVAFSRAGALVALATAAGFLVRQPLKLWLSDRRRGKRYPRTAAAERAMALLGLVGAAAAAGALALGGGRLLIPMALAAPPAVLMLAFDLRNRGRAWVAELAAPIALTSTVAALALGGGWALFPALGLWGLMVARAAPSVLYVRARLRLERGQAAAPGPVEGAQAVGLLGTLALAAFGLVPWLGFAAVAVLTARAFYGLSAIRRPATARQVGVREILWGAFTVALAAAGVFAGI